MQQEAPPAAADEEALNLLNNQIKELEEEVVLDHEISEVLRSENKRLEDELKASKAVSAAHDQDSTEATEAEAAKAADKAAKAAELAAFVATPKFETKFHELDSDKSGFLNRAELEELAQWVYISFRADNASLDQDKVANEATKLMKKLDKDGDQKICIEEFRAYFEDRAKKSAKFTAKMKEKGKHSHDMFADDPEPAVTEPEAAAVPVSTNPKAAAVPVSINPKAASKSAVSPQPAAAPEKEPGEVLAEWLEICDAASVWHQLEQELESALAQIEELTKQEQELKMRHETSFSKFTELESLRDASTQESDSLRQQEQQLKAELYTL